MLSPGISVMACVSGGTDSMCLLDVLRKLSGEMGFSLCAAHYNHGLRGAESDGDEAFVRETCDRLGVPLYTGAGDVGAEAEKRGRGVEETARDMRYAFFYKTAGERHIDRIATAHNADDNLETVLMRMVRGTGLRGLCGIPPVRGKLIRPFLGLTRAQIEAYRLENAIAHREDSTNLSDEYTRNRLRHQVVPILKELNPALNVTEMTGLLRRDEEFLQAQADSFFARSGTKDLIVIEELLKLPRPVAARVIRDFGGSRLSARHVDAVLDLAERGGPSARLSLPGLTLRRSYGVLEKGDRETRRPFEAAALPLDTPVIIEGASYTVTAKRVIAAEIYNSLTKFLVKWDRIIPEQLTVRARRSGDTMMTPAGHRTLKKMMIDARIPASARDGVPVVVCGGEVLCVCLLGQAWGTRPAVGEPALEIEFH